MLEVDYRYQKPSPKSSKPNENQAIIPMRGCEISKNPIAHAIKIIQKDGDTQKDQTAQNFHDRILQRKFMMTGPAATALNQKAQNRD